MTIVCGTGQILGLLSRGFTVMLTMLSHGLGHVVDLEGYCIARAVTTVVGMRYN